MTLSAVDFLQVVRALESIPQPQEYRVVMHPAIAHRLDWAFHRLELRRAYWQAGYPFGRNQGAFKRWALTVGRYGAWSEAALKELVGEYVPVLVLND